jgi:hypothetical protein
MVWDHTRTEREMRMTCWSDFLMQGVHRFESSRLSDMSIAYLRQCFLIPLIIYNSCVTRVGCTFLEMI